MASAMATDELNDLVRDDDADLFAPSSEDRRNEVHQPRPIHYYTARIDDHHLVHAPPDSDWMDDDDDLLFNGNDLCNFDPKAPPHLSDDEEEKDGASPLLASLHSHSHGDYFHDSDSIRLSDDLTLQELLPVHDIEDDMLYDDDEILYADEDERRYIEREGKHEYDQDYLNDDDDILRDMEDENVVWRYGREQREDDDNDDLLREQAGRRWDLETGQTRDDAEELQYYRVEYKPRGVVLQLVRALLDDASRDRGRGKRRYFDVVSRGSNNLVMDLATGLLRTPLRDLRHRRIRELNGNYDITIRILQIIMGILRNDNVFTKRDIYYQDPQFFATQRNVDSAIEDIACTIQVPRYCLNIVAGAKGLFAGPIRIISSNGNVVADGTRGGDQGQIVPSEDKISRIVLAPTVSSILVIEKEGSFRTLLQAGCGRLASPSANQQQRMFENLVVITGKGYPDVAARVLLKRISTSHPHVRILGLMDCDPHGLDILLTYKYGSTSMAFDSEGMAVPGIEWVGVFASDFFKYGLNFDKLMPMTSRDRSKAHKLLQRECLQALPVYKRELSKAWHMGVKAEIQCMDAATLTEIYIPTMLYERGLINNLN
ncbi:hypothetical protein SeLEV6574_g04304 [Synchytrium endobioticum]|uniref:DNA topoisomerase (ATP-hydrolyzing) n=2 Tax=Synchytrium endobioticum TaxID=286115 RepID=A0A507D0B1_9FUNG|nr:hypothetical protein SeLEV6574_g04304 [Synchytrium endobioticum]